MSILAAVVFGAFTILMVCMALAEWLLIRDEDERDLMEYDDWKRPG